MDQQSGGGGRRRHPKLSSISAITDEDRLSALPDEILLLILLLLDSTVEAVRTSVLSQRWRPVWILHPEFHFDLDPDGHRIGEILDDPSASELRCLCVETEGIGPDASAAWLPAAARHLTGSLVYHNHTDLWAEDVSDWEEEIQGRGDFTLPCFTRATSLDLNLGFRELNLPSAGTFIRLTELIIFHVRIHDPRELGDVVSTPRCPSLQKLIFFQTRGVDELTIHSDSLAQIHLLHIARLRRFTIVTPNLQVLDLNCTLQSYENNVVDDDPSVHILAPHLMSLGWNDMYHPRYAHLGNLEELEVLRCYLYVYGLPSRRKLNHNCLRLLQRFQSLHSLNLKLTFCMHINTEVHEYLMDDITMLPQLMSLELGVLNEGHAIGASCFHLLSMCTGIQRLAIQLQGVTNLKAKSSCPSSCACRQSTEWKTAKLTLMHLEEIVIIDTSGTYHEIAILKQLVNWAVKLKRLRLMYHSNTKKKVKEVHRKMQRFAMLTTCITLEEVLE